MLSGLDVLSSRRSALVRGQKVALLCHSSSITSDFRHAGEVLRQQGAQLEAMLGPEHGVAGAAQDMVAVGDQSERGIPVHSLYGSTIESLSPKPEWLDGIDVLVVDLQDIGVRYYTYAWTAVLALRVCARVGVRVLVLDRPNPLGGDAIEGPGIDPSFRSFVGLHDVPVRHGMTLGELLRLVRAEQQIDVDLEVVELEGWRRSMYFDQTRLPWVLPSPNMPSLETAIVYAGMCLLEGTNLSEGRGTTRPFEIFGAPWIDGHELALAVNEAELPGVKARALAFVPTFQKHAGCLCGGVQLHVTDRAAYRSFVSGVAILARARQRWADDFEWRSSPYEFVDDRPAIDLLAGGVWLRELRDAPHWRELTANWHEGEANFLGRREPFLLYR